MNFKTLLATLCAALIFFSCKKDKNNPGNDQPPRDTVIATKSSYWYMIDPNQYQEEDSIIYLADSITIGKIITKKNNGVTAINTFSYNTKGKLKKSVISMTYVTGIEDTEYNLYYNSNDTRIDSYRVDRTNSSPQIGMLTYNANQQLTQISVFGITDRNTRASLYTAQYIRNQAGYIDTIKVGFANSDPIMTYILDAPSTADNAIKLQPAVSFWLATRFNVFMIELFSNTMLTHNFFIEDEKVLRSGRIIIGGNTYPMEITHTVDAKGAMDTLSINSDTGGKYKLQLQTIQKTY